jgi:hypothetical protein
MWFPQKKWEPILQKPVEEPLAKNQEKIKMRNFTICLMLISVVIAANGTPLPEDMKKDVINGGMRGCMIKNRQDSLAHLTSA